MSNTESTLNATKWTAARQPSGPPSKRFRSAVSNGTRLFVRAPGDNAFSRRFRDLYYEIISDLGGLEILSEGQKQLARRAATISVMCEKLEGNAAAGEEIDLEEYGKLTDRLGRAFHRLGLKRRARDVTPAESVREIIQEANRLCDDAVTIAD